MTRRPIAVCFADAHLQESAWTRSAICGDSYYSFEQIIDYMIQQHLPGIGAGDLLDKNVNAAAPPVFLSEQLGRLAEAGLPLYVVAGQHDMSDPPWFSIGRTVQCVNGRLFGIEGSDLAAYGLDYQAPGNLARALDGIPERTQLLVCHQTWRDFMGNLGAPQGCFADIPVVGRVFTGDYHQCLVRSAAGRDGQKITVVSPGATCMQAIDETPEKSFEVLYNDLSFEPVRLITRPARHFQVSSPEEFPGLAGKIEEFLEQSRAAVAKAPPGIQKPIIRLTFPWHLSEARAWLAQRAGDRAHLFFKEIRAEKIEVAARRREAREAGCRRAVTLASALDGYLREAGREGIGDDCRRLLDAPDIAGELERMRQEAVSTV